MAPVEIKGRTIAHTFWGKRWCEHLESFSDYENRLPRGRTYVRNGSVIDLKITPGEVHAQVVGSSLYRQKVIIAPLPAPRWKAITKACAGRVDSLVELLQGKFSDAVMEKLCDRKAGLFPRPTEITMACSCPDWASLCKHLAAVLYGVGARLDTEPELLFSLRQADPCELLAEAATVQALPDMGGAGIEADALSEIFGIDLAPGLTPPFAPTAPKRRGRPRKTGAKKAAAPAAAPRKAAGPTASSARRAPKLRQEDPNVISVKKRVH